VTRRSPAPPGTPPAHSSGDGDLSATWWDGVHVRGTPIWCDAQRVHDICFASHADAARSLRHGQLIGTRATLARLARTSRRRQPQSQLAVPYNRPFTLGELRIELFASGHAAGAASLSIERDGRRTVYAGAVNPHGGGLAGVADVRPCDVLVIDARYGHPRYLFPPIHEVSAAVAAFCNDSHHHGAVPVVLVSSPAKGLDVAAHLARTLTAPPPTLRAHRTIHAAAGALRDEDLPLPRITRWDGTVRPGDVIVWPVSDRAFPRGDATTPPTRVALVSGAALADPPPATPVDAAFAWSNCADYAELLAYIDACGAAEVYVTGRHAEGLAARLGSVRALVPSRQLPLL